ncbi:hypothetical protein HDU93_002460, partial [Gonapodya sp. JEL0774]
MFGIPSGRGAKSNNKGTGWNAERSGGGRGGRGGWGSRGRGTVGPSRFGPRSTSFAPRDDLEDYGPDPDVDTLEDGRDSGVADLPFTTG